MVIEMVMEKRENGHVPEPEEEWRRQLKRIGDRIEEMSERQKPKLVRSSLSLKQKVEFIRTHGQEEFLRLPAGEVGPRR